MLCCADLSKFVHNTIALIMQALLPPVLCINYIWCQYRLVLLEQQ